MAKTNRTQPRRARKTPPPAIPSSPPKRNIVGQAIRSIGGAS